MKTELSCLNNISSNIAIGMDDVVAVFVSEYETTLHNKKKEVAKKVKDIKQQINQLNEDIIQSVDKTKYEHVTSLGNLIKTTCTVDEVTIHTDADDNHSIRVKLKTKHEFHESILHKDYYGGAFIIVDEPMSARDIRARDELFAKLAEEQDHLMQLMELIKGVSRKEREVRAKIGRMKLEQSGFETLLNNEGLMELIQL